MTATPTTATTAPPARFAGLAVVAGFDGTDEAADGLVLGHQLATLIHCRLEVVRVLIDDDPRSAEGQRFRRELVGETHQAVLRLLGGDDVELVATSGDRSADRALRAISGQPDVGMMVLGSTHHSRLGRVILGETAEYLMPHAECPVAVAPPGYREHHELQPPVIGVGHDGSEAADGALDVAADLAAAGGLALTVIAVGRDTHLADAAARARTAHPELEVTTAVYRGASATSVLLAETEALGLLVVARHRHRAPRRFLLGTTATRLARHAHGPVLFV